MPESRFEAEASRRRKDATLRAVQFARLLKLTRAERRHQGYYGSRRAIAAALIEAEREARGV